MNSCSYFQKAEQPSTIADKTLKEISWTTVDTYPLFEHCDETATRLVQKNCFVQTLIKSINTQLQSEHFEVKKKINDSIRIYFFIDDKGNILLNKIKIPTTLEPALEKLKGVVQKGLDSLPKLYPAIKADQPIKTSFSIYLAPKFDIP